MSVKEKIASRRGSWRYRRTKFILEMVDFIDTCKARLNVWLTDYFLMNNSLFSLERKRGYAHSVRGGVSVMDREISVPFSTKPMKVVEGPFIEVEMIKSHEWGPRFEKLETIEEVMREALIEWYEVTTFIGTHRSCSCVHCERLMELGEKLSKCQQQ